MTILDAENELSIGFERRSTARQQVELLLGGKVLQNVQDEDHSGPRKWKTARVVHFEVCVQSAEGFACDCDAMAVQIACVNSPRRGLGQERGCDTVAAAEIDQRAGGGVLGVEILKYAIESQLPAHKATVEPRRFGV